MRLRQANSTKRFRPSDLGALSDDELVDQGQRRRQHSDDEYSGESDADKRGSRTNRNLSDESDGDDVPKRRASRPKPSSVHGSSIKTQSTITLSQTRDYPTDTNAKWTRMHTGPPKKWATFTALSASWFADRDDYIEILTRLSQLWWPYPLLPPKLQTTDDFLTASASWLPHDYWDTQLSQYRKWISERAGRHIDLQVSTPIPFEQACSHFLPHSSNGLVVLLGHPSSLREIRLHQNPYPNQALAEDGSTQPGGNGTLEDGFVLDIGGTVVSLGWAPTAEQTDQYLALSVIPFSDQGFHQDPTQTPQESQKTEGAVQIWRFESARDDQGIVRLTQRAPYLSHALCSSWGRITRMRWCPLPVASDAIIGLLAVLYTDGNLRVLKIPRDSTFYDRGVFEELSAPAFILKPPGEDGSQITAFTWVNTNRIAVGHADGTVVLWCLVPAQVLQRYPAFSSSIIDIASGYPSHPSILSVVPMGGMLTMIDLNRPNGERAYNPNLMVSVQPNLLEWSEHLRGWVSLFPSAYAGNSNIALTAIRRTSPARHIATLDSQATCISVGRCHPYALIGASDGSVWALNIMRKALSARHKLQKLRVFRHEYRSLGGGSDHVDVAAEGEEAREKPRGACRVLHGFLPQVNRHPRADYHEAKRQETEKKKAKGKSKGKGKPKKGKGQSGSAAKDVDFLGDDGEESGGADGGDGDGDDDDDEHMKGTTGAPITLDDPQTRVTFVAWNPNVEFSWWAAVAMGSGLLRIVDLGIDSGSSNDDVTMEDDEPEDEE